MPITLSQANELKMQIGLWLDQTLPVDTDPTSACSFDNKKLMIDFINTLLEAWCVENETPILTLQSLIKNVPSALPVVGKDRGGAHCAILIAYLQCHCEPGSSVETLPALETAQSTIMPREAILRESFAQIADYSFLDPLARRRCKRVLEKAILNPELTIKESITLYKGPTCLQDTLESIDQAFDKIQDVNPSLKRLISIDLTYNDIQSKMLNMTSKDPDFEKYKNFLELLSNWRKNPHRSAQQIIDDFFGTLPCVAEPSVP